MDNYPYWITVHSRGKSQESRSNTQIPPKNLEPRRKTHELSNKIQEAPPNKQDPNSNTQELRSETQLRYVDAKKEIRIFALKEDISLLKEWQIPVM